MVTPIDQRRLVEQARTEPEAFAELYRAHADRVYGFAWRRLGSREAAEDVTSATFEKAWVALPGFRWRDGGFPAWLLRIAANQVTDHARRESRPRSERGQRALSLLAPVDTVGVDDEVVAALDPELRAALGRIRPRYADALSFRYFAGLDTAEAAAALDCSTGTFAVLLHRAQAALRRELEKTAGDHVGS